MPEGGLMERRALLQAALSGFGAAQAMPATRREQQQPTQAGAMAVTLLGSGSPSLNPLRFGPATVVQPGGLHQAFDQGRGTEPSP